MCEGALEMKNIFVTSAIVATWAHLTCAGASAANISDPFNSIDPAWVTDRYAPADFSSQFFAGDNRLHIGISSADALHNRPLAFQSLFYNTQGKQRPVSGGTAHWTASAEVYISTDMISGNNLRRSDLWVRTGDVVENAFTEYPILGFRRFDPADPFNPAAPNISTIWRAFDSDIGWVDLAHPVTAGWHTLEISGNGSAYVFKIDGITVFTDTFINGLPITTTFLQAYNFGQPIPLPQDNYDVYWDNLSVIIPPPSLILDATSNCYDVGQTITVHINAANLDTVAEGGLFFLNFDDSKLQFVSATPGDPTATDPNNPFEFELYECVGQTIMEICTPVPGRLDYSVSVDPFGGTGSAANNTMAILQFTALAEVCNMADLIQFRDNVTGPLLIPSRLTDEFGGPIFTDLVDLEPLIIDSTNPVLACPGNTTIQCDVPPTPANTGQATATDNCGTPTVNFTDFTVNTFASPGGWAYRTENTASGALVTGPGTPPSGVGSFSMPTGAGIGPGLGGKTYLFTNLYDGTPLASLTTLKYWTYISNGVLPVAPALNLYVDLDNNGTRDTTFVWEPVYAVSQGPVALNTWQQWNALSNDNGWWYTANFGLLTNGGGGEYHPLSYYLDPLRYPNAKIVNWVGLPGTNVVTGQASGGGWNNWVGSVDMIEINAADYDFEPNNQCGQQIFRFWSAVDGCGNTSACAPQVINVVDTTPPAFVNACPLPTINVNSIAGTCGTTAANVNPTTPTATDNCSMAEVSFVRSDGALSLADPYLAINSPIVITWTAMDACNNFSTCTQTVNVSSLVAMDVTVQLSPTIDLVGTLSRCISFELWATCPNALPAYVVSQEVDFTVTPGLAIGTTTLLVPCQYAYSCVTARDDLHTLRRTDSSIGISGNNYVAEFVGNPNLGGDWLVGGNLNDDLYIDILDFGVYVGQYLVNYGGTGNTDCLLTTFPHADITGNGTVNTGDFTFIQANFLKLSEPNCCGNLNDERALAVGPVTRISVKELIRRGMPDLVRADLNRDGWLDPQDIATFINNGGQP